MPSWFRRELAFGAIGPDVIVVQRKLKMIATGVYDRDTEARVRAVQMEYHLVPTGRVDEATAQRIGEVERHGLVPDWFTRTLALGDEGEDVEQLRYLLGLPRAGIFDSVLEDRVRQFQSQHRIHPDGTVSEQVAILIGEEVPVAIPQK
jgi:peptidoglycan hydrolase-like protein with peptidoglycan-binding domain